MRGTVARGSNILRAFVSLWVPAAGTRTERPYSTNRVYNIIVYNTIEVQGTIRADRVHSRSSFNHEFFQISDF